MFAFLLCKSVIKNILLCNLETKSSKHISFYHPVGTIQKPVKKAVVRKWLLTHIGL